MTAGGGRGRVLQVVGSPLCIPGQILPLARALAAEGWEVDVAAPDGPEAAQVEALGLRFLPVGFSRSAGAAHRHLGALGELARIMKRGGYAVAHFHGPITAVLGRLAARIAGTPAIYHCRGSFFSTGVGAWYDPLLVTAYPRIEGALGRWTHWVFTLNEADAADLARAGIPRERITALNASACGLDLSRWNAERFGPEDRARTRAELGIPAGRPVFGFAGRIVREKGVLELAEAFGRVRAAGHDAHLLMVGDAPSSERDQKTYPELRARLAAAGLDPYVTFTGRLADPSPAMAAMDCLVLPSYREGMGGVLLEAGALGVPVIAAASRGAREAVVDGVTGLLVPVRDADALAHAMLRVLERPDEARAWGLAGARRAREELGEERVIERMLQVYRRLASGPAPVPAAVAGGAPQALPPRAVRGG